jgi:hypothetical protein
LLFGGTDKGPTAGQEKGVKLVRLLGQTEGVGGRLGRLEVQPARDQFLKKIIKNII